MQNDPLVLCAGSQSYHSEMSQFTYTFKHIHRTHLYKYWGTTLFPPPLSQQNQLHHKMHTWSLKYWWLSLLMVPTHVRDNNWTSDKLKACLSSSLVWFLFWLETLWNLSETANKTRYSVLCPAGVWLWTDIRWYGGSEWTEQRPSFHGTI